MRRSFAVLLSAVLTATSWAGLHSTAAVAAPKSGTVVHTWFTGRMEPGETKTLHPWLNVLSNHTYGVSLSPVGGVGSSFSQICFLEVDRVWNEQRPEGNKDFRYTIRNSGELACAANVMVYRIPATKIGSTGGLEPNETKTFTQTVLDDTKIYQVGLLPSGATSSHRCKLEVTSLDYTHRFQGDVMTVIDVTYRVANVGDVACQGDILLGSTPIGYSRPLNGVPGFGAASAVLDDLPSGTAFVTGLRPSLSCTLELLPPWNAQSVSRDGFVSRSIGAYAFNDSGVRCDGDITFAAI
jgi:hypothetical protein